MKQTTVSQNHAISDKIHTRKIGLLIFGLLVFGGLLVSAFLLVSVYAENPLPIFERSPILSQFGVEGTLIYGDFLPGLSNQQESLSGGDGEFLMLQLSAVVPLGSITLLVQSILLGSLLLGIAFYSLQGEQK